ncbi:MAG: glycoside hydrolase family 3 protein [Lachnospiraceae bacterium]|nr:glycoside hydrolase family 3 protein [Lachnospiraceae bacterium]
MAEKDENQELSRREIRRRRRKRNQIIAYISVALTAIVLIVGIVFGIKAVVGLISDKKQETELAKQLAEKQEKEAAESEPETEEVPETETYTEDDLLKEVTDSVMSEMTLEDKVAGLFFVTPEALTGVGQAVKAGTGTQEALAKYPVGGLIYFDKNIQSEEQFKEMITATGSMAKYPLFLGVDEEGGKVARLAESSALSIENVGTMGEVGASNDPAKAYEAGKTIGTYLREYGINLDFAPVADVLTDSENKTIGDRSFGTDAAMVGQMAAQAAAGLQETGVSACVKHFPGLGGTDVDTHDKLAESSRTLEEMQQAEFLGFQPALESGVDMVMVSHLSVPDITGDSTPASLSGVMISDILRGQLGYDGIVITDALNMGAITDNYSSAEAAVAAVEAGGDMILMPENFEEAYQGVLEAVANGTLTEERINQSIKRIFAVKYRNVLSE